jgi:hypothetical protein
VCVDGGCEVDDVYGSTCEFHLEHWKCKCVFGRSASIYLLQNLYSHHGLVVAVGDGGVICAVLFNR